MHIAFLTPEYPHPQTTHSGGLGTSIKNLIEALVDKGVEVTVFVYAQKDTIVFEEKGIQFHFIADKSYRAFKWFWYRKHIQNYCSSVIKSTSIDLIEVPDWTGISAFMKFIVPVVMRFHGSDTYFCHIENRPQKKKNFWFEKVATLGAAAFIAPTNYAGELSATLFTIKNKKIKTIHYGLNVNQFENENPTDFEPGLILYIGTIIRKKGVLELPAILKEVTAQTPNAKLILIGADAPDISTQSKSTWSLVEREFKKYNLKNYSYLGQIPYDLVSQNMKKTQICVFPSFAETLGMVTIEAMAMQKPVVNTNIGWAQELMEEGISGFLVYPKDHKLFADRIITIINNPEKGLLMGKHARDYVHQHFDSTKVVAQNIQFYKEILQV
jgi:glycosyltransferase involved in cell wall biosynthesis